MVFAHRGSSAAAPEHTRPAYELAIADGVDGLECDVRLTRDGHLVCLHDRRLDRTSNGHGLVSRRTLGELGQLDFGATRPEAGVTGARVLTFDQMLELAATAGSPLEILVETKHPTRYAGSVEHALVRALRRHGLGRPTPDARVRVTVMSFSLLAIRRIRRIAPHLPTVLLMVVVPPGLRGGGLPFGTSAGGPSVGLLRTHPYLVERLRARGRGVYVWTVNTAEDIDMVLALGVDGVISDRPAAVIARMRELGLRD
jgi:glycerophosphoryl diester phosphodiesterase